MSDSYTTIVSRYRQGNLAYSAATQAINLFNPPHDLHAFGDKLLDLMLSAGSFRLREDLGDYTYVNIACELSSAFQRSVLGAMTYYVLKDRVNRFEEMDGTPEKTTSFTVSKETLDLFKVTEEQHEEFSKFIKECDDESPFRICIKKEEENKSASLDVLNARNLLKLFLFYSPDLLKNPLGFLDSLVIQQDPSERGLKGQRQSTPDRRKSQIRTEGKGGMMSLSLFAKCVAVYFKELVGKEYKEENLLNALSKGFVYMPATMKLKVIQSVAMASLAFSGNFLGKRKLPLLGIYFAVQLIPVEWVREGIGYVSTQKVHDRCKTFFKDGSNVAVACGALFDACSSFYLCGNDKSGLKIDYLLPAHFMSAALRHIYNAGDGSDKDEKMH
jgi:hypothetical protein